jgi:hypothetical protein
LNRESGATLVVVGKHDPQEAPEAAAERTLNVKLYLTAEKGIDPSRIELRTGESTGRTVDNILVPPGATWDTERHHQLRSNQGHAATASRTPPRRARSDAG